jgi:hypothetical protein
MIGAAGFSTETGNLLCNNFEIRTMNHADDLLKSNSAFQFQANENNRRNDQRKVLWHFEWVNVVQNGDHLGYICQASGIPTRIILKCIHPFICCLNHPLFSKRRCNDQALCSSYSFIHHHRLPLYIFIYIYIISPHPYTSDATLLTSFTPFTSFIRSSR